MKKGQRKVVGKRSVCFRKLKIGCLMGVLMLMSSVPVYGEAEGDWELTEDGKHWQYFYGPDDFAMDEWIEIDGREYYLDKKGYMKTGWFTDERDGVRYYMAPDGSKCKNMFLPNGNYVDPEGMVLIKFEAWRKNVRKELEKLIRTKMEGVFYLCDLNGDGYRDLTVFNRLELPDKLYLAAVWNEEEENFSTISESGLEDSGFSRLAWNHESQSTWLITQQNGDFEKDYFELETEDYYFTHRYHFVTEKNEWGDPIYCVNEEEVDLQEWNLLLEEADRSSGSRDGYFPSTVQGEKAYTLDKNSVEAALNCIPSAEELLLWQS